MSESKKKKTDEIYSKIVDNNNRKHVITLSELQELGTFILDELLKVKKKSREIKTCIQIMRIVDEYIECILTNLRKGFITQSFVLVRNLLEISNLFKHLWKNKKEHQAWLCGKEVKPSSVRDALKEEGLEPNSTTYKDLTNITHLNYSFVRVV